MRENRNGNIVTIKMPSFRIKPGMNEINKAAFGNAKFAFGNNNFGLTVNQTGKFMEGEPMNIVTKLIFLNQRPIHYSLYEKLFSS